MKILIPTKLAKIANTTLSKLNYTVIQDEVKPLDELIKAHQDTAGIIVRSEKITAEVIDALPKLKVIVRAGAGYNTIDTLYARRKGIAVMNTPGANANAVAEEVVALILAAKRHLVPADKSVRSGLWEKSKFMGTELTGKKVGIVGFGNIGRLLSQRLKGFEVDTLIYDPFISKDKANDLNVEITTLKRIFEDCDVISLHMPATPETEKIINKDYFELMKDGAILINCARCEVIDENDLRKAKETKKIIFCNDVYPKDIAGDKPIADIADIMLPHLGASTIEANTTAALRAAKQTIDFMEKGITTYVVNKRVPDGLPEIFQQLSYCLGKFAYCLSKQSQPIEIQLSLYGSLKDYTKWLLPSIVAGMSTNFDPMLDYKDAEEYLEGRGIIFKNREVDDNKNYGESITIDFISEGNQNTSIRGTIVENNLMISRINEFDKLYFEPQAHNLIFIYDDRPGVLAKITQIVADAGINIDDIRSPHNLDGTSSIATLKINSKVNDDLVESLRQELNCKIGCYIQI